MPGGANASRPGRCRQDGSQAHRWLALEADRRARYDEERGRDTFEFEPILSPYLQVLDSGFRIRTPYSRTVGDELRQVPFAPWNGDDKVWEIPFASYDSSTNGRRSRKPRSGQSRKNAGSVPRPAGREEEAKAKRRTTERKKRGLPVSSDDLPALGRPVATAAYGIVSSSPMCRARSWIRSRSRNITRPRLKSMCGPGGDALPLMNSSIPGPRGQSRENTSGSDAGGTRR